MKFKLTSQYQPTGDQPQAIEQLVRGIKDGEKAQTLLGVTGSGKTFTMANVIAQVEKPTLILSHNKTLAAQLYSEFKGFFPENSVQYFVSYYDYYQPEAYIPTVDKYIEKDLMINDERLRRGHGRCRGFRLGAEHLFAARRPLPSRTGNRVRIRRHRPAGNRCGLRSRFRQAAHAAHQRLGHGRNPAALRGPGRSLIQPLLRARYRHRAAPLRRERSFQRALGSQSFPSTKRETTKQVT